MKDTTGKNDASQKSDRLIGVVRQLAEELHEGRDAGLAISLDSALDRDLGFDSLARVELLSRIERTFDVRLSEQVLAAAESPRDLLRAVLAAKPLERSPPAALEDSAVAGGQATTEAAGARTLVDVLDWHAQKQPDRLHINIYTEGELREKISFRGLKYGAEAVAAGLQSYGVEPGRTVALMLPTSQDYFFSFFGVLQSGAVPVPLYPPARPGQIEEHLRRHITILKNCQATTLITIAEVLPLAYLLKAHVETLDHVVTVDQLTDCGGAYTASSARPDDTAFLQYTSGSTGNPKGVVLSHANLLANIRAMGRCIQAHSGDVFVSWLPLYHDMGLIGAWLGSLYYGSQLVIMPPLSFLVHPERWLWAIHRHRGTLSASPNFGYEYCLKKIDARDLEGLDLSSWRLAFNGAEPVSPETVINFPERFRAYGFRSETMTPVYGLAESSVGLAFPTIGDGAVIDRVDREQFIRSGRAVPADKADNKSLQFVACGRPLEGHRIRIVDEGDSELGERREGRLQFQGPSTTSGYFRNREQTKLLFHGTWLDSGDMAYLADGSVYITGRIKDIIIRGGRNIYPHEVEEMLGKITGIRKGCVAVFGSRDQVSAMERMVVVAETREKNAKRLQQLYTEVNNSVTDLLGLPPDQILIVPPHTVLKTSSGKLRRSAICELYEGGRLGRGSKAFWWQIVRLGMDGLLPQIRRGMRTVSDFLYSFYAWSLFALLGPPVWVLVVVLPRPRQRWSVLRSATRLLVRLSGTPLVVHGLDNIPADRPVVLASNHMSYLDGLVLVAALPLDVSFVAKSELQEHVAVRLFLRRMDVEFVERFDVEKGADSTRRIARSAGKGKSLLFFPEGTFQRIPGLLPFHMGAFVAAAQSGLEVVPVTIRGTRQKLTSGSWFLRPGVVTVKIGQPVTGDGSGWTAAVSLRGATRQEILRHSGEPDLAGTRPPVRGAKKEGVKP